MDSDNYTIVISLAEIQHDVLYSVNVTPAALAIQCDDNATFNLMLSYGSAYYVVVMATNTLCRSNVSSATALGWINLDYMYTFRAKHGETECSQASTSVVMGLCIVHRYPVYYYIL